MSALGVIISADVGKSGPFILVQISARLASGLSNNKIHAAITSPKLWGKRSAAIPTAIPVAPFNSTLGTSAGKSAGSFKVASKFGVQLTVPLSRSANNKAAYLVSFASV